jgi:Mg-chelatase subunit ChlD
MPEAESAFSEIAREGKGDFLYVKDPAALIEVVEDLLKKEAGKSVDMVICMDTTGSMKPYIDSVRIMLVSMMKKTIASFTDYRIGMVLFKDYYDEYLNKVIPFTKDFDLFQRNLNSIRARGGGDIPEAVYEALYEGTDKFPWAAESRLLILIGDAPPHPKQRGKISREMVYQKANEKEIKISAIILSQ